MKIFSIKWLEHLKNKKTKSILELFTSIIVSFMFRVVFGIALFSYFLQNYLLEVTLKERLIQDYEPLYKISESMFKQEDNLILNYEKQQLLDQELKRYFANQKHLAYVYVIQKENYYLLAESVKKDKFSFGSYMKPTFLQDYDKLNQENLSQLIVTEYSNWGYPKTMHWIVPVRLHSKIKDNLYYKFNDDIFDNLVPTDEILKRPRFQNNQSPLIGYIDIGIDTEYYHREFLIYWISTLLLTISLIIVISLHLKHKIEKQYVSLRRYINDFHELIQSPNKLNQNLYNKNSNIQEVIKLREHIIQLQHEQKELYHHNKQSFDEIHQMQNELQSIKMFFATVTHEVRNNLNIINGLQTLDPDLNSKQIHQNIKGLLKFTNDILDLSKIEAHRFELVIRIFNLKHLLRELIDYYAPTASTKNVALVLNAECGEHSYFYGDDIRIKQVFANLLSNAIKFSLEYSEVIINLKLIYLQEQTYKIVFEIKDFGVGINQKCLTDLFKPYQQFHFQNHKSTMGTGLGLVICKEIVDLMKGSIHVHSQVNQGTIFTVSIDLVLADAISIENHLKLLELPKNKVSSLTPSNLKILIVDDIDFNRQLLEQLLKNMKFLSCDHAENGLEAYDLYQEKKYDLIFMDIQMPVLDGLKASEMIKEYAKNHSFQLPIIIGVTANYVMSDDKKYDNIYLDKILLKPFNPDHLYTLISEFFSIKLPETNLNLQEKQQFNDKNETDTTLNQDVPQLKHIDIHLGIESAYGNKANWLKAVNIVFGQLENFMNQLKYHYDHQAYDSIRKVAHKLAGSVSYCGMPILHHSLKELETAIVKKETESVHKLLLNCQKEASEILKIAESVNFQSELLENHFAIMEKQTSETPIDNIN